MDGVLDGAVGLGFFSAPTEVEPLVSDAARFACEAAADESSLRAHLQRKENYRAFLGDRKLTRSFDQRIIDNCAVNLARAINDFAVQPKNGERWTPQWEQRFVAVWHELLFRESVIRLVRESMREMPRLGREKTLSKDEIGDSVLSTPRSGPEAFSDRRCFSYLYWAVSRARFSESDGCFIRICENTNLPPKEASRLARLTFTDDGLELISLIRRRDPSGRRSIVLYRAWTETRDRRKNSTSGAE